MKKMLILPLVLIVTGIITQQLLAMSIPKTETQPYQVVHKTPEFEIRFYPAATMATVSSKATTYKEMASPGFRRLASFIFGGNESNTSIAMTAPVHMDINDSLSSMSFVMPSGYNKDNLPKPKDASVRIETSPEEYVAAIRFGGYASDHDIKKYAAKLEKALKAAGITHEGNFRFLGYNPPYRLFGRRNEVIVRVQWNS